MSGHLYIQDVIRGVWVRGKAASQGGVGVENAPLCVSESRPEGSTQVIVSGLAENGWTMVYTVSVGMTLHLCSAWAGVVNNSGTVLLVNLVVRNALDAIQYYLVYRYNNDREGSNDLITCSPPLEIPAGWDIAAYSNQIAGYVRGSIFGYEM